MKKLAAVFLSMLAAPLILAQACTAQQKESLPYVKCTNCAGSSGESGSVSLDTSGTLRVIPGGRTCTITFKTGNLNTDGCDFSQPMKNPKMTPVGPDHVKLEFEQPYSASGMAITPSYITPKDRQ